MIYQLFPSLSDYYYAPTSPAITPSSQMNDSLTTTSLLGRSLMILLIIIIKDKDHHGRMFGRSFWLTSTTPAFYLSSWPVDTKGPLAWIMVSY
jgi:hypothetical protein